MGLRIKDLENVGNNLERGLQRRSEQRAEELLQKHGFFGLMGILAFAPVRIGLFLGGLASAFAVGSLFLNKWVGGLQTYDNLLLTGGASAALYWFFAMRKYPLAAPFLPMGILLWILTHGGL